MYGSARMGRVGESATLKITRRVHELRAQGADLIDLAVGEPDFCSPAVAVEAAQRALQEGYTRYTQIGGDPDLLRGLSDRLRLLGAPWSERHGMITVGAKAALFELALSLLDQDDEAVIPAPCWVSLPEQVRLAGARAVLVPTAAEKSFEIRARPLVEALTDRTRVVILNSPCNPTGGTIVSDQLRLLVEECSARGVVVVSDETYDRFLYDGRRHASIAALASEFSETSVLVGSFSKTYAMTGWRVGYVFGPDPVIAGVRAIQSHATSNVTSFAMKGALAALQHGETEVAERIAEFERRRALLVAGLRRMRGVECSMPWGAFYAFPDVSSYYGTECDGSASFAEWLLQEAGVVVVPGSAFGADRHVRVSFATSRAQLSEGLERMEGALERLGALGCGPKISVGISS